MRTILGHNIPSVMHRLHRSDFPGRRRASISSNGQERQFRQTDNTAVFANRCRDQRGEQFFRFSSFTSVRSIRIM
jgi:hypothetical protein